MADYTRRTLQKAIELITVPGMHTLSTFFRGEVQYLNTRVAEVHILRGGRPLAPFVEPHMPASVQEREGFKSGVVKIPYIKPSRPLRPSDLQRVQAGGHIYDRVDPAAQMDQMVRGDLTYLKNSIMRREEWMANKSLCGGVVQVVGDGINATITYPYLNTHKPTLGSTGLWTHADSDPVAQLRAWGRLITKDSGKAATDLFLGEEAADAFLANAKVIAYYDRLNMTVGRIQIERQAAIQEGSTRILLGTVEGVNIWEIRDWYDDGTGTLEPMVPPKAALLGSTNADNRRNYGVIELFDAQGNLQTARTDIFIETIVEKNPDVRHMIAHSAPLPIPHDLDAFVYVAAVTA